MANSVFAKNGARSRAARFGMLGAAALSLTLTTAAFTGTAHADPSITVTPSTGLTNNQSVTVAGSGLTAADVYHIGECAAVSPTAYACAATNVDVAAGSNGTLSTPLTVLSSFTGAAADGSTYPIDCTTLTCVIGVFDSSFSGGSVPISFSS